MIEGAKYRAKSATTATLEQTKVMAVNSTVDRTKGNDLEAKINSKVNNPSPATGPAQTAPINSDRAVGVCQRIGENGPRPNPRARPRIR